jgi:hypothetical protein
VPADLALEHASRVLVLGSLAATLLAFAVPVALAGAATPLLVAALAHARIDAGRASGLVGAFGTLGSLAGTFLTTHVLVPELGSRSTIWIAAAGLGVAAWVAAPARGTVIAVALLALVPLAPQGPLRPASGGEGAARRGRERLPVPAGRALAAARRRGPRATVLRINEGLDSFHSIKLDGTPWTNGRYYDWFVALPRALDDDAARRAPRVLSLGAAAGTFERLFRARYPRGQHAFGRDRPRGDPARPRLVLGLRRRRGRRRPSMPASSWRSRRRASISCSSTVTSARSTCRRTSRAASSSRPCRGGWPRADSSRSTAAASASTTRWCARSPARWRACSAARTRSASPRRATS